MKILQLADSYEHNNTKFAEFADTDNHCNIVTGKSKTLINKLIATKTLFGSCLQGYMDQSIN